MLGNALALHDHFADGGGLTPWDRENTKTITRPLGMSDTRTLQGWLAIRPGRIRSCAGRSPGRSRRPTIRTSRRAEASTRRRTTCSGGSGTPWASRGRPASSRRTSSSTRTPRPAPDDRQRIGLVWNITPGTNATCISKAGDGQGFHAYVIFVAGAKRGAFLLVNDDPKKSYRAMGTELLNSLPATPGHAGVVCPVGNG